MNITIQFDGGCRGNPGSMYGSYSINLNGSEIFKALVEEYGDGTNNVAEFEALNRALVKTLNLIDASGGLPEQYNLLILTDSTIVRNRINGGRPAKAKYRGTAGDVRMTECTAKVKPLIEKFRSWDIQWQPREHNVEKFGH